MSYNMKNKIVVMFAVAFSLAMLNSVNAEENNVADITPPTMEEPQVPEAPKSEAAPLEDDPFGLDDQANASADEFGVVTEEAPMPEKMDNPRPDERGLPQPDERGLPQPQNPQEISVPNQNGVPEVNLDEALPDVAIDNAAPKTPFEKYGNTILSRVDNELFNQMSEIEKQTTLLNLELKREEVKNRIDALKAQRERAKQEELDREAAREKQARDEELQRQKALLQEQMKLKEKEMELEKIRQAKIINEYMNEMLVTNQQWVEINAKLSAQIKNLQEERVKLMAETEKRFEGLNQRVALTNQLAEETRVAYERKVSTLNKQIEGLKQVINEKDSALRNMANGASDNPFATAEVIDENAVDMSKEYAIMDITGKGDNIVAKIVSQDGTTFTVRKGSVLKGGEVVVNISDKFITFENHGVKSYLYTGGAVMQYEPQESFNDAPKTPEVATGVVVNAPEIHNVRGTGVKKVDENNLKDAVKNTVQPQANKNNTPAVKSTVSSGKSSNSKSSGGIAPFSQGMMVK